MLSRDQARDRIAEARTARDAGIAQAEAADLLGWNRRVIDQGIDYLARTGEAFSANDLRELLPDDLPGPLFGARFLAACKEGRITRVGWATSTKKNTHAKPVGVWIGCLLIEDPEP